MDQQGLHDFSKCYCTSPGFCPVFSRTMGENPPDWRWCQKTSESERKYYYELLKKSPPKVENIARITKNNELYASTRNIISYIFDNGINGIVGVPRSGMIPASILSVATSLPLYSIEKEKVVKLYSYSENGGYRMQNFTGNSDNLLFVDDTCYGGVCAKHLRKIFGNDIKIAVVFSTSRGLPYIDFASEILEPPHILEWNFFNCSFSTCAMFDIDGVFCPNVPIEVAIDDEKYVNWIANVKPYFDRIPKLFQASKLVTGRLEKYRSITEAWLLRHGFNYKELIMFPTEREKERNSNHYIVVGRYKADHFNSHNENFFVESEHSEASIIKSLTDKVVICMEDKQIL